MNRFIVLNMLLGMLPSLWAAENPARDPHETVNPNVEEYIWEEGQTVVPPYPREENLQEFFVHQPQKRFKYFIDKKSLSVGKNDVIRYSLVVRSVRGGETAQYEGIRCGAREYKGYAYGNGRGAFRKVREPVWKAIGRQTNNMYRYTLVRRFLCATDVADRTPEKIIENIQFNYRQEAEDDFK